MNNKDALKLAGRVQILNLASLNLDESHQRGDKAHAEKIAKDFDPAACDALLVCQRPDGSYWDVDGRQRRKALMQLGYTEWICRIVKSTGPEFEAKLFITKNGAYGTVKPLSAQELFKGQLVARDKISLLVVETVEAAGLRIRI